MLNELLTIVAQLENLKKQTIKVRPLVAAQVSLLEIVSQLVGNPGTADKLTNKEWEWLRAHNKIAAIKEYRVRTGAGLKEAKDYIEAVMLESGFGVRNEWGSIDFPKI